MNLHVLGRLRIATQAGGLAAAKSRIPDAEDILLDRIARKSREHFFCCYFASIAATGVHVLKKVEQLLLYKLALIQSCSSYHDVHSPIRTLTPKRH